MTWNLKKQNKNYLIHGEGYSFTINNHHDAQKLVDLLNTYTVHGLNHETEKTLDNITTDIINLQMTVKILSNEVDQLISKVNKK